MDNISLMKTETYTLKLKCFNCGVSADYQIPQRRVFMEAQPEMHYFSHDGTKEVVDGTFSFYKHPFKASKEPMVCANCKVAMLVRDNVPSGIWGLPPQ